jgi:tRNA-(ms[2]io[6]A)-hydroxylase
MGLLADALPDASLARLYRGLLAAEARHFDSYVDLARGLGVVSETELRARLAELAEHEAEVVRTAPPEPRLHG